MIKISLLDQKTCEMTKKFLSILNYKGKYVVVHQVSDESDDDSGPPPRFERYMDFDNLSMDADAGQDNDDKLDSVDSNYDDKNLRMDY